MSTLENSLPKMFGNKTSQGQLYGGFFLLIGGALAGLAALILFFISLSYSIDATTGAPAQAFYALRHIALPLGTAGGAALLLGVTVALPTKTSMRITSYVGTLACAVATLLVFVHYPNNFNVSARTTTQSDYMALDVGIYALGLALLLASIFTSIIGYYLDRLRPSGEAKAGEEEDEFAGYEVPDWVVERDIEYAMKKYGVTFAGDDRDSGKLHVNINTEMGGNVKVGGLGKARTVQIDAEQVDVSVTALSGVRPNKKGALPGEWADESTRALVAFRRRKADNPTAFTPRVGFWSKVKRFFVGGGPQVQDRTANLAPTAAPKGARKAPVGRAPPTNGAAPLPRRGTTIVIPDEPAGKGR
ncbi:MAG: DUF7139 domain-containing protein [Thermoplasmatota archaeon]